MIHHYINLVCWRPMLDLYEPDRDIVWIDTVSLRRLVASYREDAEYRPGTSVLQAIGPQASGDRPWFFLTAGPVAGLAEEIQFELPLLKDIAVSDDLAQVIHSLEPNTRVGIGISAPKQNRLAAVLHALRPDLEYHCLGAAVDAFAKNPQGNIAKTDLSGSGMEWLRFLFTSPKRTWGKIEATLKEMWLVRTHRHSRVAFAQFAKICTPAQTPLQR